jgi:hypothetical protein
MLNAYPKAFSKEASLSSGDLIGQTWVDLIAPTEAEQSVFESASGLRMPSENELGEIEATSRLPISNDALYMTAPLIFAAKRTVASDAGRLCAVQAAVDDCTLC